MAISAFLLPFLAAAAAATPQAAVMEGGWISQADYPADALRAGQQGTVQARFLISPEGSVSKCEIAKSSGATALDARTCELVIQRFRFAAARDASGKPVEQWRAQMISWKLPADAAPSGYANARLQADVKVDVDKDGSINSCEVIKPSGDRKFDNSACAVLTRTGKLAVMLNERGRPKRSTRMVPVWQ